MISFTIGKTRKHSLGRYVAWGVWLRAAFLSCALCLCAESSAIPQQSQPTSDDKLILFFYKNPQPEKLSALLSGLQRSKANWNAYPPIVGLLSVVFAKDPEWPDKLSASSLDEKAASAVFAALKLSGQPAKAAALRNKLGDQGFDPRLSSEFADLPDQIDTLRISTPTHIDIFWGASFASGDERYVRKIIDFFAAIANKSDLVAIDVAKVALSISGGSRDGLVGLKEKYGEAEARQLIFAGVALWGLRANAAQHSFVRDAISKYLEDHPKAPAARALSAATGAVMKQQ